jgi:hypothetical protein
MAKHRICSVSVASVYPYYVAKAEKKGRTKAEVDTILRWLTGHSQETLDAQLANGVTFEDFFAQAPAMNPSRSLITGVVCSVRVEEVEEPTMREIRHLDKLVDELARGTAMDRHDECVDRDRSNRQAAVAPHLRGRKTACSGDIVSPEAAGNWGPSG